MAKKKIITLLFFLVIGFAAPTISYAQQPTFGPACEAGVTCIPTTRPTTTVRPTAIPTLLRTGTTENTVAFLGLGGLFLFLGTAAIASYLFLKI